MVTRLLLVYQGSCVPSKCTYNNFSHHFARHRKRQAKTLAVMRAWLTCRGPWQGSRHASSRNLTVWAAKSGKSATKTRRQRPSTDHKAPGSSKAKSKLSQMAEFRADEVLLFDPVPTGCNAALQVVYAYPNEYSVGITSLGYQLVGAHALRFGVHPCPCLSLAGLS